MGADEARAGFSSNSLPLRLPALCSLQGSLVGLLLGLAQLQGPVCT